ncbi:MAG: NfeD family protein [Firmicutes bacterium]|nr:NfeD family protein [Bacillota bacterium]
MTIAEIMIIVWAVVIALALFIEFLSYDLVSVWFAPAALVALVMAALNTWIGNPTAIPFWAQIIVFIVLSIVFILSFRPLMKKILVRDTIPSDITTSNIGKQLRLTSDTIDGHSTIELNGVTWKVEIENEIDLAKNTMVELTGSISNKFKAKAVE